MRRTAMVSALVLVAAATSAVWAQQAQPPASALDQARAAYDQRANATQAKAAFDGFQQAAKADAQSYDARWQGARAAYFYGEYTRADASDAEKMAVFQTGIDLAKAAVALNAKGVEGHFWLGVLYGVYGEAKGIFKSLSLVPSIKEEMNTCIQLDPSVEEWGPDRVLGRMFYRLPFFKGGDNTKSIEHLERSLKGAPNNALTRLYLAEVYKSEGMKPKAIEQCRAIISTTPEPQAAPEYPSTKAKAERLLKKLT